MVVAFQDQVGSTVADATLRWQASLGPMPASASPSAMTITAAGGQYVSAGATLAGNAVQAQASRVSAPKRLRYGWSGAGDLPSAVSIPTEGGSKTVTALPGSLFELAFP